MKITDRLIGDHKTFIKMLNDIESIYQQPPLQRDRKKLIRIVELFKDHLLLHAWFEDHYYYPAITQEIDRFAGGPVTPVYMQHLDHEHKTIDGYLDRLEAEVKAEPPVTTWPQTYALFGHGLYGHMKREEQELFPESERVLGSERLNRLSEEMEKERSKAPKIRLHAKE